MNLDLAANSAENRYQYFRMLPFGTVTNLSVMINDFLHSSHADKWTSRMPTTKNHGVIFVVRTKVNKYWYIFHSKGSNRMTNSYVKMINAYFPDYLNNDCRRRWLNSSQMAVRTCNKSITKGNKREKTNIYFNILSPRLKSTFL